VGGLGQGEQSIFLHPQKGHPAAHVFQPAIRLEPVVSVHPPPEKGRYAAGSMDG
jgi:hypothetical protein